MQEEEVDFAIEAATESMNNAVQHLERSLVKIRAGKASPEMLDGIMVEYYGAPTPLKNVSNVGTVDARTITITPWEKKMVAPIERAIFASNMGMTPQNDGVVIRLMIPPMTEERRQNLAKQVKGEGEHAKVSIRNARRDAIEDIRKAVKGGYPEDAGKRAEEKIQKMTDAHITSVEKHLEVKERDILTV